jgi:SpoVK/Ycf46/Vps4 family AAA+-type ATPase
MFVSHLLIDATSTTEAGMRKALLDEDAILPEVIVVEEIEKARHSFHLLLGLMDDRATVTQMNFKRTESRKVPALILASANDYEMLKKTESGALLSRFSNEIYCPRPGREILAKILEREIRKVKGGSELWIEPTLRFCHDQRGITDPRMLKRVCLCGKERLITGEYQRDLEATMMKSPGRGLTDVFD